MDYDKTAMPEVYDVGRGHAPDVLGLWLRTVEGALGNRAVRDILDLGCGTGRFSTALAVHFGARVIAVDPSEKMLSVARRKAAPEVDFIKASAEKLPLGDSSVDLVFISMAFHHFEDPRAAVTECRRVLRRGGTLCLRGGTADRADDYPFVPFFARSADLIRQCLPSLAEMTAIFSDAGFRCLRHEVVISRVGDDWGDFAVRTSHRADSILHQLDDAEFKSGLAALRAHAKKQDGSGPVVEPIDFLVFRPA